jgi:tetratricopeptide (TPR) repeat protein
VDARGLVDALRGYQSAEAAALQPARANVKTKINYGRGRVYLCLSQAQIEDYWAKAEQAFKSVVADYESGNPRVQDLAAESHAHLGIVYSPAEGAADTAPAFRQAAEQYQKAIELSRHPDRQAFFNSQLGYIYGRLKDYNAADSAYAEAARLDPAHSDGYEQLRQALRRQDDLATPTPQK